MAIWEIPSGEGLSTDELTSLGWHPRTALEELTKYGVRVAYHKREAQNSGAFGHIYHCMAAAKNRFTHNAIMDLE